MDGEREPEGSEDFSEPLSDEAMEISSIEWAEEDSSSESGDDVNSGSEPLSLLGGGGAIGDVIMDMFAGLEDALTVERRLFEFDGMVLFFLGGADMEPAGAARARTETRNPAALTNHETEV